MKHSSTLQPFVEPIGGENPTGPTLSFINPSLVDVNCALNARAWLPMAYFTLDVFSSSDLSVVVQFKCLMELAYCLTRQEYLFIFGCLRGRLSNNVVALRLIFRFFFCLHFLQTYLFTSRSHGFKPAPCCSKFREVMPRFPSIHYKMKRHTKHLESGLTMKSRINNRFKPSLAVGCLVLNFLID